MIGIIDYQASNLPSVKKALDWLGAESVITSDPQVVGSMDKLVLPGVGNFAATQRLYESGLSQAISSSIEKGKPFLGICVGMQWLFEGSDEAPLVNGLGLFQGRVERFAPGVKVPHVGWNSVESRNGSKLFANLGVSPFVYYTHSYRCPITDEASGVTEYGGNFAASVERGNVFGVQFHPEKSGEAGLEVLKNFLEIP